MQTPRVPVAVRRRVFYGWWIVAAAFCIQILHSSTLFLAQGLYLVEWERAFGWSRGSISWAFAMIRVESGILGPIQGWMIDRFGPRPVMMSGAISFGLGFFILSQVDVLWQLYVAFVFLAIGTGLAGFLTVTTAIANWFMRKRARAMSVTSVGFASGAMLLPIIGWSIANLGWRETAFLSGIAVLVVGVPASMFFRRRPEEYGMRPDGDPPPEALANGGGGKPQAAMAEADFTVREALRDRAFWLVTLGHGTALLVVATMPVHLVPYLQDESGWSLTALAFVFPALMVMQITGQIGGGILGDRYSKRLIAAIAMFGHGSAMIILAFSAQPAAVAAAIALHGLAWGARGPLMMAIRADYFGRSSLGMIAGWSNTITMGGSIVGPILAGTMYDSFGSYQVPFLTIGMITTVSTVFFMMARKPPAPKRLA
ncbi:MAG: MFS transporter [Dehalococcoidia bacterium]